jgi:hypothetical protein
MPRALVSTFKHAMRSSSPRPATIQSIKRGDLTWCPTSHPLFPALLRGSHKLNHSKCPNFTASQTTLRRHGGGTQACDLVSVLIESSGTAAHLAGMVRVIICYLAVYSLGYDGSLLNGLQALPAWQEDFGHPKGHRLGLIAAAYYLPKIPGAVIIAWCCDRFGRKPLVLAGAVFMIAGAVLGGLASTYAQFVGSRVILGVGTACSREPARDCTSRPTDQQRSLRRLSSQSCRTRGYDT